MRSDLLLSSACVIGLLLFLPSTAVAETGALTQLPGTDACVSEDGSGGDCADGVALEVAEDVAVSRDGRNVYVASIVSSAVAVFARDRRTGALTQLPGTDACVSEDGTGGDCADGVALINPTAVTVSPDGRNVYVASGNSDAVAVFARNRRTGALSQLPGTAACVSADGTGGACAEGIALDGPSGVTVSADGRNVYVASSNSNAVAVFGRDRRTGALAQLSGTDACSSGDGTGDACAVGVGLGDPNGVTVSPDGRSVYVASRGIFAVTVFARDRRTGALTQLAGTDACVSEDVRGEGPSRPGGKCADGIGLNAPQDVTVSPDGRNVYVASAFTVALFARDRKTGALTQLPGTDACVSEDGSGGDCADGVAIDAYDVAVSPDGRNVYIASQASAAVAVFARDRRTGALTQLPGTDACVSEDGTGGDCADGVALINPTAVTVSPDGRNVYVASEFQGNAVAVFARANRHFLAVAR